MKPFSGKGIAILIALLVLQSTVSGLFGSGDDTEFKAEVDTPQPTIETPIQCVNELKIESNANTKNLPSCSGGLQSGGGFGFYAFEDNFGGNPPKDKGSLRLCLKNEMPWTLAGGATSGSAPFTDVLAVFANTKDKEDGAAPPVPAPTCPASYTDLGLYKDQGWNIFLMFRLCGKEGEFPDLEAEASTLPPTPPTGSVIQSDHITGYTIKNAEPFSADITLPFVEDVLFLSCKDCSEPPACPANYQTRGELKYEFEMNGNDFEFANRLCVKYNLACACQTPDQCKDLCESTDAASSMPVSPPGYPIGAGGGFAVDGGPGVWVKETKILTPPFGGTLPFLPPEIVLDGTSDPFFLRLLRPDGTVFSGVYLPGGEEGMTTSVDSVLNQKGNCCLDGDECEPICTRNDPAGVWLAEAEPFFSGVKLFEDPKFGKCVETGLGAMLRGEGEFGGEKTCGHIINGPCCGDDDKGERWFQETGGDCADVEDGNKQLCLSTAPDGEHKWMSAEEGKAGGEEEVYRPVCQPAEWEVGGGKWKWAEGGMGCDGHRRVNCYFKYQNNGGDRHGPVVAGFFGGSVKSPGDPCFDAGPYHRVVYCGETDNDEPDGGINFAVSELAHFFCGFTYCRHTNTFGKDLDGKFLEDCESFPIIKAEEGTKFPPWMGETVMEEHLVNTGSVCCGEVDDDMPNSPFDGEFYNDPGGIGACFINYQPNGEFLKHNVQRITGVPITYTNYESGYTETAQGGYIADGYLNGNVVVADLDTREDRGAFVFNGTLVGCNMEGSYNPDNDYLIDIKDNPNPGKGKKFKDDEFPIRDPTEGETEPVIRQQSYCSKTGPPEDIQKYYCSYTEQWLERNETERNTLKSIAWKAEDTLTSQNLTPPISTENESNETLSPASSRNPHYLILGNQSNETSTNESVEKYLFLDKECCGITQCWDGYRCMDDQSGKPDDPVDPYTLLQNGDGFRCLNGVWKPALLKYTPNGSESGYCPRNDQCLYDLEGNESQNDLVNCGNECAPQCIADSQYLKDDYCDNGAWTSRTRLLAQALLDKTRVELDTKDYTLFCDVPPLALNNVQNPGNVNNDCVLQFDEPNVLGGTERHVLLGATYNGDRNAFFDALRQSLILSYDNLDANSSEVQNLGADCTDNDDYTECATLSDRNDNDVLHLYHHGPLRIVVMSGKSVPGFNTNPILDLFTFLKDLFRTILSTTPSTAELSDFKQLYLSGLPPQRIYGIAEILFSVNKSTNETKIFDHLYTIEYTGYQTDFNTLLGGVTAETKQVNGEAGNQTVLLVNPSQDLWRQFTEQLRPKRPPEEPEE